jgi:phenylalanyl-tRNA synthetase beta chain
MKFTLSWLKDHLDTDASVEQITDTLTDLGLEVEEVTNPADRLRPFTLGKVVKAEQHPDADRLRVCEVDTDEGIKQIICGAPNARAGITVVVCKPGDYVPGIDVTLSVGKIRGVESHGMMASEKELELSEEHDGIIELPNGKVGDRFVDWLAENAPDKIDPVIEIAITPNRQDALGVEGIARDLAARGLGKLISQAPQPVPGSFDSPIGISIDDDTLDGAPHFTGRLIKGVKNGPSPEWLQQRLKAIGLRPISALVDITNFFTFDRNRPLHVFDADKVQGNLRVHRATGGETLTALDDKDYTFEPGMMIISDDHAAESIAGVMGGASTGCTDDTVNVFVESAYWDPITIAHTGRKLKINSDAKYRFERGVDPAFTLPGLEAATQMILELCGGEASHVVQAGEAPDTTRAYKLDTARCSSLVGMDIPAETQRATLESLGFTLDGDMATPPSWRPDVKGEADLVEEVARIASLTNLEPKPMPRMTTGVPKPILTQGQKREQIARRMAAALGYNECVTYSFIDQASAELFGGGDESRRVANPISQDMTHMRPSHLPGLLHAAARNQARGINNLNLFEVGAVFHGGEPDEHEVLVTGLKIGATSRKDVHGSRRNIDLFDARADAEAILQALGAPAKIQFQRPAKAWWHPGRSARMTLGPKITLAAFGELHPKVLKALDVKGPAVAFAIHINAIPTPKKASATRDALKISDLQAVERDFAFVLDANVEAITVVNAAQGADKALIEEVRVFDEFVGGSLGEGKKSLAITVRMQPSDKTLTDDDIDAVGRVIVEKVGKATGGVLRG